MDLGQEYVGFTFFSLTSFTPPPQPPPFFSLRFSLSLCQKNFYFILPATILSFWFLSACQLPLERGSDVSGSAFIQQWSDLMWDWDKCTSAVLSLPLTFSFSRTVWWRSSLFFLFLLCYVFFILAAPVFPRVHSQKSLVVLVWLPNYKGNTWTWIFHTCSAPQVLKISAVKPNKRSLGSSLGINH